MLNNCSIILECSRFFSLPMTIMSWLVIFVYALTNSGNALYGVIALIGISLVHLATNVLDDYFDYKNLIKQADFDKKTYLKNTQKPKCRLIVAGIVSENEMLNLASIYLAIAGFIGLFFYITCGKSVIYFMAVAGIIAVLYSFLSKYKLSEVAVAIAYGPALFGGVNYVMTKTLNLDIFLLSLPTMFLTVTLLYIHTVMDYDFDINEGKHTISNSFDSQLESLVVLKILLLLAYISPIILCIFDILDWQIFSVYLTIPMAIDLYRSMQAFSVNSSDLPIRKWYHRPMENFQKLEELNALPFMFRMYQARNVLIYYGILMTLSIIFTLI